ncbi:MAG TPA: heparan-alpha-glucosaminide N-acetyltransferase domain-containing protein [Pyrinomonadaceae bacterium]|jgi:uncharacterized membrane protein|nr:heparan-alpha-glucosaminide N-acetyltransferase domain-containing protein [Pyrinomonadaceae bacterium]
MTQHTRPQEPPRTAVVVEDPAAGTLVPEGARAEAVPLAPDSAHASRLDAVDLLRGLVMVIMALDHTRDFFHSGALTLNPTDLSQTTPALFFTRWITHFCAPVFVFLAGTGAFLSLSRGRTKKDLSWFLLTRGLWLVVLEWTLVRFAVTFDLRYSSGGFVQVIWALGWSMVLLAALVRLPLRAVAAFGLALVAGHNLLDRFHAADFGAWRWLWMILHEQGPVGSPPGFVLFVVYPLVPWVGVMAAGYAFGALLRLDDKRRRKILLQLGLALTLAFVVLRATNLYGDPRPWAQQPRGALYTFLSFINCEKYPPSLLFLLMTLGPAIALLPLLERARGALARFFTVYGRVPLFYYLLHFYLLHVLAAAIALARYGRQTLSVLPGGQPPPGWGYRLWVVYLVWIGVVLALYFPCRYWARLKQRKRSAWLSYL